MESGFYWAKYHDGKWEVVEVWGDYLVNRLGSSMSLRISEFTFGEKVAMDENEQLIKLSDVKRLIVNDGDTLVLLCKDRLSKEAVIGIKKQIGTVFDERNIKILVLENGMDIAELAQSSDAEKFREMNGIGEYNNA